MKLRLVEDLPAIADLRSILQRPGQCVVTLMLEMQEAPLGVSAGTRIAADTNVVVRYLVWNDQALVKAAARVKCCEGLHSSSRRGVVCCCPRDGLWAFHAAA